MASDAREREIALMEAEMIAATDAYFKARHPMLDTIDRRRVYEAGFKEAWNRRAPAPEVAGRSDREGAPFNCRMPDGRCAACGGDWSVCGCQGMFNRAARSLKESPNDNPS